MICLLYWFKKTSLKLRVNLTIVSNIHHIGHSTHLFCKSSDLYSLDHLAHKIDYSCILLSKTQYQNRHCFYISISEIVAVNLNYVFNCVILLSGGTGFNKQYCQSRKLRQNKL